MVWRRPKDCSFPFGGRFKPCNKKWNLILREALCRALQFASQVAAPGSAPPRGCKPGRLPQVPPGLLGAQCGWMDVYFPKGRHFQHELAVATSGLKAFPCPFGTHSPANEHETDRKRRFLYKFGVWAFVDLGWLHQRKSLSCLVPASSPPIIPSPKDKPPKLNNRCVTCAFYRSHFGFAKIDKIGPWTLGQGGSGAA